MNSYALLRIFYKEKLFNTIIKKTIIQKFTHLEQSGFTKWTSKNISYTKEVPTSLDIFTKYPIYKPFNQRKRRYTNQIHLDMLFFL